MKEQSGKIEILRICQLAPGDKFMMSGVWFQVINNRGKNLKCKYIAPNGHRSNEKVVIGSKSQLFVQVERA